MELWIEVRDEFEKAYRTEPIDESLIGGVYSFADWCLQAPRVPDAGHEASTAVIVCFYEHIPTFRPARDDMPRWFRFLEVEENREVFSYFIDSEEFGALLAHMAKNRHRYRPRPSSP
jgi:hypothetical protein